MKKFLLLFILIIPFIGISQLIDMGNPVSFTAPVLSSESLPLNEMPSFDLNLMLLEDSINNYNKIGPWRFGKNFDVNFSLENSGTWDILSNGDRIWRLRLASPGAMSMNVIFDNFYLPEGSRLIMYSVDHSHIVGSYTSILNNPSGIIGSELVLGDDVIIEYFEPNSAIGDGVLKIGTVTHGYKSLQLYGDIIINAYDSSGDCNHDVDCPAGVGKENQIRSVAMIVVGGNGACTGALVNNTNNDGTPYFLTANHCLGNPGSWVFRFNWHATNPSCGTTAASGNGSYNQTTFNATLRASNAGSDVALVQMNGTVPNTWNPFYAGWDRTDVIPSSAYGIHHPSGDLKKICLENNPLSKQTYSGAQCWQVANWDVGVTEPGSSGSPLFDPNGRIIGQLYGGGAACSGTNDNGQPDYYGRFGISWDNGSTASTRLKDWLDPTNSNVTTLNGYDPNAAVVALDAGITVIISPDGTSCGASFTPEVTVRNFGSSNLTSCVIRYRIDAGALQTYNWTGNLATNATANVTLNAMTTTNGAHTFTAYTQNPNGGTDGNSANDSQTSNFTTTIGTALPLAQTFQTATFPPTNYTLNNGDGSTTWARTTAAGSGSTASMFMDNWNYNAAGAYDWFILPTLDFTSVTTGTLSFDVAYAYYDQTNGNGVAYDTLGIAMTNDCGASWFWVWKEGGVDLATAGGLGAAFTPTAAQWENIVIDLNDPAINNQANVQFAFISINDYGNNLYVDNINVQVSSTPTPPVANFTANATSVCAGTQVAFTNSSTNSPTSYAWSFPGGTPSSSTAANPTITYNTAGTYTVSLTATNADGSDSEVKTNYITVNPNPSVSINPTNPSCNNGTNGSATAVASGGSSFTYSWTGASGTGATVNNLGTGTYSVLVTNNFSCTGTASTTLTQPSAIVVNVTPTSANCGAANGSATATASGGVGPYTYSWSGGSNTNLSPGNYTVTVTDANLCTKTQSFTIGSTNTNLTVNVTTVNETCGQANGSASATASGGTAPYTYTWSGGSNTSLAAGSYTVTATDANGCTGTANFTITNSNSSFVVTVNTMASACSSNTGTATATVNGSAAGYTFSFSAGTSTGPNSVSGLGFGSYSVNVTNAQGCTVNQSFTIGNLNAPVINAVNVQNILCNGGTNGAALAQVSGGTAPYQYNWGSGFVASSSINSLTAGNYNLVVNDASGCSTQSSFTITEPSALVVNGTVTDDHCAQGIGSISLNVSGGTPNYSYTWNGQSGSATNSNLQAGTYTLNVLDANSCSVSTSFTVQNIAAPSISNVQIVDVNCFGGSDGSINVDASGTGTLSFDWGIANTEDLANVPAGTYTLEVSDAFGCSSVITEMVGQPAAALDLSLTVVDNSATGGISTIASVVTGGTQPYTYNWSNSFTAPTITNLSVGLYSLTLIDANGCIDTASASIGNVGINDQIWLDNISLYPNPTSQYLNIDLTLVNKADIELEVYNTLGQIIYKRSITDFSSGKEQISMTGQSQGVYFLRISSVDGMKVFPFTKQ